MEKGYTVNVLDHGYVRYIDHMGSDERICEAARISYKSPSKGDDQDKKLLAYLWKNKHTSPFEQVSITYNIKLPLFVQGQMVRHRTQRLNQVSARYTEMVDEFYIPKEWRKQDTKNKQGSNNDEDLSKKEIPIYNYDGVLVDYFDISSALSHHCKKSYQLYKQLLDIGVSKEMARMLLPQNLYTEIYSNWDLNNLTRFFSLRIEEHAQLEIREYAKAMLEIAKQLYPWTIEAYEKYKWKLVE
jgi:thymidylate synthase (FAD)